MKIEPVAFTIEGMKRQHIPFTITDDCPDCGHENPRDYSSDEYLSYPELDGTPVELYFCCTECDHEWQPKIDLRLVVTEVVSPETENVTPD